MDDSGAQDDDDMDFKMPEAKDKDNLVQYNKDKCKEFLINTICFNSSPHFCKNECNFFF